MVSLIQMATVTSDITQSIQNDITRFSTALTQWTTTYNKHIADTQQQHDTTAQHTAAQSATLQANKENVQHSTNTMQQQNAQQQQLNTTLQHEYNKLSTTQQQLPKKQQLLQQSQQQYSTLVSALQQQIQQLQQQKSTTINNIVSGISIFKNVLGIEFTVLQQPRGVLRIQYKYISAAQPSAVYSVDIYVNKDEQYMLSACVPTVYGVNDLVEQLNRHNRFDLFVMQARQMFQQYADEQE